MYMYIHKAKENINTKLDIDTTTDTGKYIGLNTCRYGDIDVAIAVAIAIGVTITVSHSSKYG